MASGTAGQQTRSHSKNIVGGINHHHNPHNVYSNNTAYGCRDNRDNSITGGKPHPPLNGPIFGAGIPGGPGDVNGAYNDH